MRRGISSGIASGKTRTSVEQFYRECPEWSDLIAFVLGKVRYRVISANKSRLSVDFVEPPWHLSVHQQAPGCWAAMIYDLADWDKGPYSYIAPLAHVEGDDKIEVAGQALNAARARTAPRQVQSPALSQSQEVVKTV